MTERRAVLAVAATTGFVVAGVLLLSVAASGAGPEPYPVVLGGTATPVAPITASPSPGASLVFVNAGAVPFSVTRTATPFALATTIAPSSTSSPYAVPTATGSYPYTAALQSPLPLGLGTSAGPTIAAEVVVASPSASVSLPVAPVSTGPTVPVATTAPASTTARASAGSSGKRRATARRSSARPSASPSATSTAVTVGGLLPAPAQPPLFSNGVAVPLPVLPTGEPSPAQPASGDAGATLAAPIGPAAPVATVAAPLPVGPFAAAAPRQGPRRSRGLPIALAVVLLLGVAGAVARTVVRTGRWPRRTR